MKYILSKIRGKDELAWRAALRFFSKYKEQTYLFIFMIFLLHALSLVPFINLFFSPFYRFIILVVFSVFFFHIKGSMFLVAAIMLLLLSVFFTLTENIVLAEQLGNYMYILLFTGTVLLIGDLMQSNDKDQL